MVRSDCTWGHGSIGKNAFMRHGSKSKGQKREAIETGYLEASKCNRVVKGQWVESSPEYQGQVKMLA